MKKPLSQYTKEELIRNVHVLEQVIRDLSNRGDAHSLDEIEIKKDVSHKEKYSSKILDALPDVIFILNHEGIHIDLISSDDAFSNMIGRHILDFIPVPAKAEVKRNLEQVISTGTSSITYFCIGTKHNRIHFENRLILLDDKHIICIYRDVTEIIEAREKLETANQKMKLAEKMASLGRWSFFSEKQQFEATEIICSILEQSKIKPIKREDYYALVHPEDLIKVHDRLENPQISTEILEHRIIVNGKTKYLHTKTINIYEENGYNVVEGYVQEVTEIVERQNELNKMAIQQKKQQDKIKELNSIMDMILNNVPVYLYVKDTGDDFRYLYWNKMIADFSQMKAEKVIGYTDFDIFPRRKDAEQFRNDDLRLFKNGGRSERHETYEATNGETRILNTIKTLVPFENKAPLVIGVSWDITEMKRTEKELIEARIKAEQSDKLKSAFLANISHEIRTPLNSIVGFSKLIADVSDDEERQDYINIIDSNTTLLLQLISDILDLSKIEAGTLEFYRKSFNVKELCQDIYDSYVFRIPKEIKLVYNENSPDITIWNDNNKISQILLNLLTNALKFTKQGKIEFGFNLLNDNIEFYVKDTGIGIAKEKSQIIFDRFTKLDSFVQGSGLGLAICKTIIEHLGGCIWVESEEKVGSTFKFTIPFHQVESEKAYSQF